MTKNNKTLNDIIEKLNNTNIDISEWCCGKFAAFDEFTKNFIVCLENKYNCKYKQKYYTSRIGYHTGCNFYDKLIQKKFNNNE